MPIFSIAQVPGNEDGTQSFKSRENKTNEIIKITVGTNGVPTKLPPFDREFILGIQRDTSKPIKKNQYIQIYERRYTAKKIAFNESGYKLPQKISSINTLQKTSVEKDDKDDIIVSEYQYLMPQLKPRRIYEFALTSIYQNEYDKEFLEVFKALDSLHLQFELEYEKWYYGALGCF